MRKLSELASSLGGGGSEAVMRDDLVVFCCDSDRGRREMPGLGRGGKYCRDTTASTVVDWGGKGR